MQVTPASPHLLHGLVDEETDLLFDAAPPLLALVPQASRLLRVCAPHLRTRAHALMHACMRAGVRACRQSDRGLVDCRAARFRPCSHATAGGRLHGA